MACGWYCCCCNFGPHDGTLHTSCMQCEMTRCAQCSAEEMTLNTNIHCDSSSCGLASAYPAAVPTSLPLTPTFKPTTHSMVVPELSGLEALPQTRYTGVSVTSSRGIRQHSGTKMYICCGCRDGPKVYAHQPQCVICSHKACTSCVYVKWECESTFLLVETEIYDGMVSFIRVSFLFSKLIGIVIWMLCFYWLWLLIFVLISLKSDWCQAGHGLWTYIQVYNLHFCCVLFPD